MTNLKHIESVLWECRTDFEKRRIPEQLLARVLRECFPKYGNVSQLLELARVDFPLACCRPASAYTWHKLGRTGRILYGYFAGSPHYVVGLGKDATGKLLIGDITADQFGGPKVYAGPVKAPWMFTGKR